MKYSGYDVYDIIYRNDSTVKGMLERDLMYLETGFITLQDTDGRIWYLYKKTGILVPEKQEYIERSYGRGDTLPRINRMRIGKDECDCSLPDEDNAKDFYTGLSKIGACSRWRVEKRLWKILSEGSVLYDGPAKTVRMQQNMDRVTLLRCAYASDRRTRRRNFTNFSNWKYISSHEMTTDGKVVIVRKDQGGFKTPNAPEAEGTTYRRLEQPGVPAEEAKVPESAYPAPGQVDTPVEGAKASEATYPAPGQADTPMEGAKASEATYPAPGQPVVPVEGAKAPEATYPAPGQAGVSVEGAKAPEPAYPAPGQAGVPAEGAKASEATYPASGQPGVPAEGAKASEATYPAPGQPGVPAEGAEAAGVSKEELSAAAASAPCCGQEPVATEACGAAAQDAVPAETGEAPEIGKAGQADGGEATEPAGDASAKEAGTAKRGKRSITNVKDLLDCDKRRCRLESYEENMLYDIKRGHWDLFDNMDAVENPELGKLIPRDPRKDIRTGVVGIDFGTKSTVVVRQADTNAIMPIRIGAELLSAGLTESDYENPTIIECTNLDEFISRYYEEPGRPQTSCEDFFVSYDAYNDYRTCLPGEFYAYYADLKQWSNHQKENVLVLDKQGHEYRFGAEGSQEGKIINPIELYAYYIGLYINNMRNGIYMKYLMSFPVGYSKDTRQLILNSFERGIRKSLPTCILEDGECMKDFSVRLGISEPAAYAVTALEMSDLEPEDENDRYRYGIFDFGGGTADFGFGIWRGASEEEYDVEGYDYVLECFGADSDVTLGGENILEMLSYAVFKKNRETARRKRITCSLPFGEQAFLGSEALISDSQIARRNMSILKEELRPLWHQEPGWEEKYRHEQIREDNGGVYFEEYIDLSLYDIDGKKQSDCRFVIDTEELIALIKARIQKGIDAFFKCMSKAFQKEDQLTGRGGEMYIFLAGNSSKSMFVKELFEKAIEEYSCGDASAFVLMEPLNSENRRGYEYVPNAKTSVAYGLIKSREGSSIKVEKNLETDAEEQTRFKYYLGRERRRHFDCKLSPAQTEYGSWVRFQGAARQTVRIYYTTDPTADVKAAPPMIDNIPYREITVEPQDGAFIFIRTCEPTVIEYAVAFSEERIGGGDEIRRIDFRM